MIGVMVRVEDRDQRKLFAIEVIQYRRGIPRIHDRGVASIAYGPDVVVGKRPQGNDFECSHRSSLRIMKALRAQAHFCFKLSACQCTSTHTVLPNGTRRRWVNICSRASTTISTTR